MVEWESGPEEGTFIADGDDGSIYFAEECGDHWHFEWWNQDGELGAEKEFRSFDDGAFEMCQQLKADGWTVNGVEPTRH